MDQRLKHIMDNYDKMKIDADEPFKFRCTMCGKCCIDREDILLNSKDLYNISKELSLKTWETVDRYCDTYVGESSRIPIVRLKPVGVNNRCPLLQGSRCSVHKAKPTVCAMFPIGRVLQIDAENIKADIAADKVEYIFTDPKCGDERETHTVREWLGAFGIPMEDEFFLKWQQTIAALGGIIHKLEKKCEQKALTPVWNYIFSILYLGYDTEKEFMPQFESNSGRIVDDIEQLLNELEKTKPNGGE